MPSLIQRKIDKKYEIRVFYLMGNMYSMAIMSQNKNETEIDFRNYQNQNPNRTLSYELPDEINKKIIKLMDVLKLNSGSIDFIYNTNNEYVFLEVNPVGQYGMVSYPCNYYIEKKIANYLTNE
jgi:glutathione synthase/RimK-type ligase-like ATP-grasp enzyme